MIKDFTGIVHDIEQDETMQNMWTNYVDNSFYVEDITWENVIESVDKLVKVLDVE